MFLAQVTGSVVATQKVDNMRGQKLLIVEPFRVDQNKLVATGRSFVSFRAATWKQVTTYCPSPITKPLPDHISKLFCPMIETTLSATLLAWTADAVTNGRAARNGVRRAERPLPECRA